MPSRLSLKLRLIISALVILTAFIALTGIALDRAYYSSSKQAVEEYVSSQVYVLMAATEADRKGEISMAPSVLETKFSLPSSGLYAYITNKNKTIWKSLSTIGINTPKPGHLAKNEKITKDVILNDGTEFMTYAHGVQWKVGKHSLDLTFNVQLDLDTFTNQLYTFRQNLWGGLVGMSVLLIIALSLLLYWGLLPLRRVAIEINAVETGNQQKLAGEYPAEIHVLTENINKLIEHEQQRRSRYKNALGDLAHSLKTPLAIMRSALDKNRDSLDKESGLQFDEQISTISNIIQYQLQRAATVGQHQLIEQTKIKPLLDKIISALNKVYAEKNISFTNKIAENLKIKINADDAMEVFGNLIENACKWTRSEITCTSEIHPTQIKIHIQDNGPGIKDEQKQEILKRGVRMDSQTPGHGIGLAIVQDILAAYDYELEISQRNTGGACFTLIIKIS